MPCSNSRSYLNLFLKFTSLAVSSQKRNKYSHCKFMLVLYFKPKMPHFKGLPLVLPKARNSFRSFGCNIHPGDAFGWEILYIVMEPIFSFPVVMTKALIIDNYSHYWLLLLLLSLLMSQCICGLYVCCCYIMCEL